MIIYSENMIPKMTSNTTPSGVASASNSNNNPFYAFDGDLEERWRTTSGVVTGWLKYEFPEQVSIAKYSIVAPNGSTLTNQSPKNWTFEGSNNNTDWAVLDTQTNITSWGINEMRDFIINEDLISPYKYYRINITQNNGGSILAINELKMYEIYNNKKILFSNKNKTYSISLDVKNELIQLPSESMRNLIDYGIQVDSYVQFNSVFTNKNYILSKNESENADGLWEQEIDRKPLSIKFE